MLLLLGGLTKGVYTMPCGIDDIHSFGVMIIKCERVYACISEPHADCSASASGSDAKCEAPPRKRRSSQGVYTSPADLMIYSTMC